MAIFQNLFFFDLTRKYQLLVGSLFSDIYIKRYDSSGNETELIKVPITAAPKEKMLSRVLEDPGIDRPTATLPLPMISFEMGTMKYDGDRKLNTSSKYTAAPDTLNPNNFLMFYNPVPYNINFKVYIYSKNPEDSNKILEQILPFFTPDWSSKVNLIPEMNVEVDIPIILTDVSYSDNYDQKLKERRAIIWTLSFILKGYYFGPNKSKPVIKYTNTNFYALSGTTFKEAVGNSSPNESITVQPGLTSAGEPTTDIDYSIPVSEITANSDYGYIITVKD